MNIRNYTIGFASSLLATCASFAIVDSHLRSQHALPSHDALVWGLLILALTQLAVQMIFFLHIGRNSRARDLVALAFAASVAILIVGGSLWIMANLTHEEAIPFEGAVAPQHEL